MLTTNTPEQLFTSNFVWFSQGDGNFTAASGSRTYTVAYESLTTVHPLLLDALEAKLDYQHRNGERARVYGDELHWLATYLRHGALRFNDATGKELYVPLIYALKEIEGDEGFVEMECWDFTVVHVDIESQTGQVAVPIITAGEHQTVRLRKSDIEQRYPGWEQRLAVGRELGVARTELARMAFTEPAPNDVRAELSDVRFD